MQAARALASSLAQYAGRDDVVVVAVGRGGIPTGHEVARALGVPFEWLMVRKIGIPGQEERTLGAIASGGVRVINTEVAACVPPETLARATRRAQRELAESEREHADRTATPLEGRTVIVVDDGLATGITMRAAVARVRKERPARVITAVPVAAHDAMTELDAEADEVVCLATPVPFGAISRWYTDFRQVDDVEIRELLGGNASDGSEPTLERIAIDTADGWFAADLRLPQSTLGLVLLAGDPSAGRTHVSYFHAAGLATLQLARSPSAADLERALGWAAMHPRTTYLGHGLLAAPAVTCPVFELAARHPAAVSSIVALSPGFDTATRGLLGHVPAPTLFIVGARDAVALSESRDAVQCLPASSRIEVVAGAGATFSEPGAREEAARIAVEWFRHYL